MPSLVTRVRSSSSPTHSLTHPLTTCTHTDASLSTRASLVRASAEIGSSKRTQSIDVIERVISRKVETKRVFGMPLATTLAEQRARGGAPELPVPLVVFRAVEFLMAQGLDRTDTFTYLFDKQALARAKEAFDTGTRCVADRGRSWRRLVSAAAATSLTTRPPACLLARGVGKDHSFFQLREPPEIAFQLLLSYLQSLPESLIPDEYFQDFTATASTLAHLLVCVRSVRC